MTTRAWYLYALCLVACTESFEIPVALHTGEYETLTFPDDHLPPEQALRMLRPAWAGDRPLSTCWGTPTESTCETWDGDTLALTCSRPANRVRCDLLYDGDAVGELWLYPPKGFKTNVAWRVFGRAQGLRIQAVLDGQVAFAVIDNPDTKENE